MYADLKKLKDETHPALFNMALSHLLDIGFRQALKIKDSDIEKLEENGLMTRKFVQDLVRLSRQIAQMSSPTEIIQFAQSEQIFDTLYYNGKPERNRIEEIAIGAIDLLLNDYHMTELIEALDMDEDEIKYLGY